MYIKWRHNNEKLNVIFPFTKEALDYSSEPVPKFLKKLTLKELEAGITLSGKTASIEVGNPGSHQQVKR